jgi:hypothetical protein
MDVNVKVRAQTHHYNNDLLENNMPFGLGDESCTKSEKEKENTLWVLIRSSGNENRNMMSAKKEIMVG